LPSSDPVRSGHHRVTRRGFLTAGLAGGALVAPLTVAPARAQDLQPPNGPADRVAQDEAHWARVASHYRVTDAVVNLEAGYWGVMADTVHDTFVRHTERVNRDNSYYARRSFTADLMSVRERLAAFLKVGADEIAFTRSATESLQCLIAGYNRLEPGDAVVYADLDYPAMQNAMSWLKDRRGARVVRIELPEPATRDSVLSAYSDAFDRERGVRLVLLTHVSNKTGLVIPVREICALARQRGIDVIVDAAHAIGQMDVSIPDIGADFVGFNLHKWIGAPLGIGVFYIRKDRLADVDRMMGDDESPATSILSRVHTGTTNFAAFLTIPAALDFHGAVGPAYKAARLRYLRDRWVKAVRRLPPIEVLTPDEPGMSAGITSFRLRGRPTRQDNLRIVDELLTKHRIFTAHRTGIAKGDCVRVTPALYTTAADVDRLAAALVSIASAG
jgi:selenocysteine lyase/cysteine desulfurase